MYDFSAGDGAPSDIARMGRTAAVNRVRSIHDRMAANAAYVPAAELDPFASSIGALEGALQAVVEEGLDDQPLCDALVQARIEAQVCRVAFRALLDGVLRFDHSALDVDQFLLRTGGTPAPSEPVEPTPDEPAPPA